MPTDDLKKPGSVEKYYGLGEGSSESHGKHLKSHERYGNCGMFSTEIQAQDTSLHQEAQREGDRDRPGKQQ